MKISKKPSGALWLLAALAGIAPTVAACGKAPEEAPVAPAAAPVAAGTIVLGDVSDDVASKIDRWQPLAQYLAANLGAFDVGSGSVKVARDPESMVRWLRAGEVDLYVDSFYPATLVMEQSGATLALLRQFRGAEYHAVLVAKAGGDVRSPADLAGRVLAMEKAGSTSGFMLPMAELLAAGLRPVHQPSLDRPLRAGEVAYVFSQDDDNTIHWTLSGKVDAGAVDSRVFAERAEGTSGQLRVVHASEKVLQDHLVLARPGMNPDLLREIRELLVGLPASAEGAGILEHLKSARFVEASGPVQARLARQRELYERVEEYRRSPGSGP